MTKITPYLILGLPNGKIFILFACINILSAAFGFWLSVSRLLSSLSTLLLPPLTPSPVFLHSLSPETRGLSIEDMDVLFGSTTQEARDRYVSRPAHLPDVSA